MTSVTVEYRDWLERAFPIYKDNIVTLIVAMLLACLLFGLPLAGGVILMTLDFLDGKKPPPEIGDVFKGLRWFVQLLLLSLVVGAIVMGVWGALLFVTPWAAFLITPVALAVGTLLMFAPFLIVDRRMNFRAAAMTSIKLVAPCFLPLLGLYVLAMVLGSVGLVACYVGVIVTAPMTVCLLAVAYREVCTDRRLAELA
ncbi:MAG: hypothetical protein HY343_05195 [Lentisphaerae bacterium]|nr:hypothetical protein [Lentisphaerota bacterium]